MNDPFIPLAEVQRITGGKSRSTIYRWSRNGILPKSHRTGTNSIGRLKSEIDAWIEQHRTGETG